MDTLADFRSLVEGISWHDVSSEKNHHLSYDIFLRNIKKSYDSAFPLRLVRGHKRSRKPWISRELYKRITERNKLFDKFIRSKDQTILTEYKQKRNKLNADLKKARLEYYKNKFIALRKFGRKWESLLVNQSARSQYSYF
ncbi:unnamed protein product [Ixodes pacificus]